MRPIQRGQSPIEGDFENYRDSFPYLISRLGSYCSFCERRIATNLAVEHIQPKADGLYPELKGRWDNFLLGCVNCNSTKGDTDVRLNRYYLPDRDNTFFAFTYLPDGSVQPRAGLTNAKKQTAQRTLELTGLDKARSVVTDEHGNEVAVDRAGQRMETWLAAEMSKQDLAESPSEAFRRQVVRTAVEAGYFSVWMAVFEDDAAMRRLLIEGFTGTAADCFDQDTLPVSPRPNNGLDSAGKI
jgi:uncharacterized protein (TIGR02646 family)